MLRLALLIGDFCLLNLSLALASLLVQRISALAPAWPFMNGYTLLLLNATWLAAALVIKLYNYHTAPGLEIIFRKTWRTYAVALLLFTATEWWHWKGTPVRMLLTVQTTLLVCLVLGRLCLTYFLDWLTRTSGLQTTTAILMDEEEHRDLAREAARYFRRHSNAYDFRGYVKMASHRGLQLDADASYAAKALGAVSFAVENNVRELYTTLSPGSAGADVLVEEAERRLVRVKFLGDNLGLATPPIERLGRLEVYTLKQEPLQNLTARLRKRIFDVAFSVIVILLVLSWLAPLLALVIMLESQGGVFFRQRRTGRDGEPFWCFKFRSMHTNEEQDSKQAVAGDRRITKVGAFIRRTSLDELPQFFNVLLGDMSIVGPRPHMLSHTEQFSNSMDKFMMRHFVRPGITGWAQVNGYRGETREPEQLEGRLRHDLWYLENWSLMLDIRIVFMTIINMTRGK
jgi:Undecaprenyl-phosphate glucose phosphotransferase